MRHLPVLAALLVVGIAPSACGGETEGSASGQPAQAAANRTGAAGVTVDLPSGWHVGRPADGNVIDPVSRVIVSSAPVRLRQVPCQIARYAPPANDVTLVVVEWEPSKDARPEPRPASFTRETLQIQPPLAIECFDGPGGSTQFVDEGRVFGAYLLIGERAPQRLVEAALEILNTLEVERPGAASQRLRRNGLSIDVPPGWDGRMLFRDAAGSWGVVYQVANFELPPNEGFEPPRELPPGEEDPIKAMAAGDVLVTVVGDEAGGEPAPATITLDDLRFLPADAPRLPRGHALAEGSFCYGTRCIRMEVDFGGRASQPTLRTQVDEVLASLVVEQARRSAESGDDGPRGCPRENWPGPWTACAEAEWVRRLVEEGGYRVVGDTGSALVAEGNDRSFYVWTTRAGQKEIRAIAAEASSWRRLAGIEGVAMYGDDHLWRFWEAQGFIFWVQEGPSGNSVVPSPSELTSLLQASKLVLPPPRY